MIFIYDQSIIALRNNRQTWSQSDVKLRYNALFVCSKVQNVQTIIIGPMRGMSQPKM